jgi:hypothetical protein
MSQIVDRMANWSGMERAIGMTFPSNGGQAGITQFRLASNASGLT